MKLKQCVSFFAIAAIAASCTKQGPVGPAGQNGANGVANIYTQQYTVTSSNWSAPNNNYTWIASYNEPDITDNNNDAVEVYWSTSSSGWLALPVTGLISTGDEMSYGYDNGIVTFSYYTGGSAQLPPSSYTGYSTIYFKVTVIPPAIQAKYPHINWKDATQALKATEVQQALTTRP